MAKTTKKMVIPTLKGAGWYLTDNFSRADLVTDKASNKELGISDISFRPIDEGFQGEADVTVRFDNGLSVFARLYKAKDGQHLVLNFQEKKQRDDQGRVTSSYVYNVRVPLEIQAQVLRHAQTFMQDVEVMPAEPAVSDRDVAQVMNNVPAQEATPAPASKVSVEDLRKKAMQMSEEELEAMFAK